MELKHYQDNKILCILSLKESMILRCALCSYIDSTEIIEDEIDENEVMEMFRKLRELNLDRNRKLGILPKV